MKMMRIAGVLTCIAALAGCGGSQLGAPGTSPIGSSGMQRTAPGGSWMSPSAAKNDLLYVSVYSFFYGSSVYVLSWPGLSLVGQLDVGALGMCSDKDGNVYMATGASGDILEYAHGGSSPIKTLSDANNYSYGCSVDPSTGDLAVTNLYDGALEQGSVLIYPNATGSPQSYQESSISDYYFCGYDHKGNLFVDGVGASDAFVLAEILKHTGSWRNITLNASIGIPGNVQAHGTTVAIGDQGDEDGSQAIDQFSVSGSSGTQTGETSLTGAGDVPEAWIGGKYVAAPDTRNADVELYDYPAGGNPIGTYSFGSDRSGFGATLSVAPKAK
jgi:hypothetical protein